MLNQGFAGTQSILRWRVIADPVPVVVHAGFPEQGSGRLGQCLRFARCGCASRPEARQRLSEGRPAEGDRRQRAELGTLASLRDEVLQGLGPNGQPSPGQLRFLQRLPDGDVREYGGRHDLLKTDRLREFWFQQKEAFQTILECMEKEQNGFPLYKFKAQRKIAKENEVKIKRKNKTPQKKYIYI